MGLKEFLKPTKSKLILSVLILVTLNLYIRSIPNTNIYITVPQPGQFNVIGAFSLEIILYIPSYLVSCIIAAVYSLLKKK